MSRIFIGGLTEDASRTELEREFEYFGALRDVWVARNPPGFGFIVYEDARDAQDAVREMDGKRVCGTRIRVEFAKGGTGGSRGRGRGGGGGRRGPPPGRDDYRDGGRGGGGGGRFNGGGSRRRSRYVYNNINKQKQISYHFLTNQTVILIIYDFMLIYFSLFKTPLDSTKTTTMCQGYTSQPSQFFNKMIGEYLLHRCLLLLPT